MNILGVIKIFPINKYESIYCIVYNNMYAFFFSYLFASFPFRKLSPLYLERNSINGFYGMIGPNIERKNTKSLLDLFMGNGVIQGIFINNGTMTYIKREVETEKRKLEKYIFKKPSLLPNPFGVANTALFYHRNLTYALFERDLPYLIDIDFKKKNIRTVGKYCIEDVSHFSAHPKVKVKDSFIENIDYDVLRKNVKIHQFDPFLRLLSTITVPVKYIPMVHDFISTEKSIVFLNSPFKIDYFPFPKIKLDVTKTSIFYLINREKNNVVERFYCNHALFIFHYADVYENEEEIEMYAPVHDSLDFSTLNIRGKYRKIVLNKKTKVVRVDRNEDLENLYLEFPVSFYHEDKKKVLLRYVEDSCNTGFVICHKHILESKIHFPGKCICGEPSILIVDNIPYALFFTIDIEDNGYVNILNLVTTENTEIVTNQKMKIGFHSLFLPAP